MILIDTDVMVDVLRRYEPAIGWLESLGSKEIGLPGLVAMELIQGCRDLNDQQRVQSFVSMFSIYWPSDIDCERAFMDFAAHRLANGLGLLDSLIAETAIGRGAVLVTFNGKHYGVIRELQTLRPYSK